MTVAWVVTEVEPNYETVRIIGPFYDLDKAQEYASKMGSSNYGVEALEPPRYWFSDGDMNVMKARVLTDEERRIGGYL